MLANLTLDFNCLISLENNDYFSGCLQKLVDLHEEGVISLSVPAISASEKKIDGEYLQNIQVFFDRIDKLSNRRFKILKPIMIWDMGYWDYGIWADEEMIELDRKIHSVLFPNIPVNYDDYIKINALDIGHLDPKWRNAKCDVISLWCHIYYKNDIFITSDRNFYKQTKKDCLIALGAKKILSPQDTLMELGY